MPIGGVVIQFSADASKARREIAKLTRLINDIGKADGANKKLSRLAKIGIAGVAGAAGAGVFALGRLAASAVTTAADFEKSQNILQAAAGASGGEMEKLSALAKQLGMATSFSAMDASDAMIELAKAGLSVKDILGGATAAAMALAATEGIDLATASVYMANAMAMFGVKAKDAGKVADILAAGSKASTASVEGLAQGLKYVGSTANGLDASLLDTVTALAALNTAGIDASTAGTSFNRMLLGIAAPTSKAADAMEDYGLAFLNAKGEMLPMRDIIASLREELGGLSSSEQATVLKRLFGVEGMRAAAVLMKMGGTGWAELQKQIAETGVAAEMADARTKGFWGAIERLRGAWETLKITLGTPLMEVMTGWINDVTKFLESPEGQAWITTLESQVADFAKNLKTWVEDTLAPAIQSIWTYFSSPEGRGQIESLAASLNTIADAINAIVGSIDNIVQKWAKTPDWLKGLIKITTAPLSAINKYNNTVLGALGLGGGGAKPIRPAPGVTGGAYAGAGGSGAPPVTVKVEPGYYSTAQGVRVKRVYGGRAVM